MSNIKVKCDKCSKVHLVNAKEFDFEQVDSDKRQMGAEITYEGNLEVPCECGNSIEITHRYWEYPEGVENYKETDVSGASVIENTL